LNEAEEAKLMEIREEAEMMHKLGNHPNIIGFVGAVTIPRSGEEKTHLCLVTEYCQYGSLYDLIVVRQSEIPLVTLIRMARDAAAGILHLHREGVIHRDIAARNVLVGADHNIFIADFGMARIKQSEDVNTTKTQTGPVKWMAPECLIHRQYSEASDCYAYGVLLWEMVTKRTPWEGLDPIQVVVAVTKKNTRLLIPPSCDPVLKKIIKSVWQEQPAKRMTMTNIVTMLTSYHDTLKAVYQEMSSDSDSDELGLHPLSDTEDGVIPVHLRKSTKFKSTKFKSAKFKDPVDGAPLDSAVLVHLDQIYA